MEGKDLNQSWEVIPSLTAAAQAVQETLSPKRIALNHCLGHLLLCRDIRGNTRGLHSGEEAIRKPRIPSGRKSGFISGSGLHKACLQIMRTSETNWYTGNLMSCLPMIVGIFRGAQNSGENFLAFRQLNLELKL